MTTREGRFNFGVVLIIAAVALSSMLSFGAATAAQGTADYRGVQLQDLGKQTDQCVQSSPSTDSPACQQAAAKAKEVQAQPIIVNLPPRRTDAEIKDLIEQTIREHPELIPRGTKGDAYVLTDADKQAIADMVLGKIPVPKDGLDGKDATVDYDKIVQAVLSLIPTPKDGVDGQTPACMATTSQCVGDTGPEGRGIDPVRPPQFVRLEGGQCVFRMFFTKAPDTVDVAAGTFACAL